MLSDANPMLKKRARERTFQTDNVPVSHLAGRHKDDFFSVTAWTIGIGQQEIQGATTTTRTTQDGMKAKVGFFFFFFVLM